MVGVSETTTVASAEDLRAIAATYQKDAEALDPRPWAGEPLTNQQWSWVYRAIHDELVKVASRVDGRSL